MQVNLQLSITQALEWIAGVCPLPTTVDAVLAHGSQ